MEKQNKGLIYHDKISNYFGDITKKCGLTIQELDNNFYYLRGEDILSINFDNNTGKIILSKLNGDIIESTSFSDFIENIINNNIAEINKNILALSNSLNLISDSVEDVYNHTDNTLQDLTAQVNLKLSGFTIDIQNINSDNVSLSKTFNERTKRVDDTFFNIENNISNLKNISSQLENKLIEFKNTTSENFEKNKTQLLEFQNEVQDIKNKYIYLKSDLEKLDSKINCINNNLSFEQNVLKEQFNTYETETNKKLESISINITNNYDSISENITNLKDKLKEIELKIQSNLYENKTDYDKQIGELKCSLNTLQNEFNLLSGNVENNKIDFITFKNNLNENLNKYQNEVNDSIQYINEHITDIEQTIIDLNNNINNKIDSKTYSLQIQIDNNKNDITTISKTLDNNITKHEKDIAETNAIILDLTDKIQLLSGLTNSNFSYFEKEINNLDSKTTNTFNLIKTTHSQDILNINDKIKETENNLKNTIGEIPENSNSSNIVSYINETIEKQSEIIQPYFTITGDDV